MILRDVNNSILNINGVSFYDNSRHNIYYLCEYLTSKYLHDSNIENSRTEDFVLGYKGKDEEIINKVFNLLKVYLAADFTIAVVPSSHGNTFNTASHILAKKIIEEYGESKNLIDGSACLRRFKAIESQHLSPKERNIQTHLDSIIVEDKDKINGKNVLLLDDIVITGTSIQACIQLLKVAGAKDIVAFAVGKTFNGYNKKPAFIFDLDHTLYDTSSIKIFRDDRNWKEARKLAEKIKDVPYPGVKKFIDNLKNHDIKCCIVTRSPRNYAQIFAEALGIEYVIAYHDVANKKDKTEAYFKAKQLLRTYERDIFVVGDEESDILPDEKLSMNTIRITKEKSIAKYKYETFQDFSDGIEEVIADNYNILVSEVVFSWDSIQL